MTSFNRVFSSIFSRNLILAIALSSTLAACGGGDDWASRSLSDKERSYSTEISSAALKFSSTPAKNPKIFLVAGSNENANFAQEIIDQKKMWLSAGFNSDEIACFYSRPFDTEFLADEDQFRSLAKDLESCLPASTDLIADQLVKAGIRNPQFLYVYVTSHGASPETIRSKRPDLVRDFSILGEYWISMDSLANGDPIDLSLKLQRISNGVDASSMFLTPRILKNVLSNANATPKYIVLQACHSCGFVDTPEQNLKADRISNLQKITAITASREDRSSFGCDSGSVRTVFGEKYNQALSQMIDQPTQMNWRSLFDQVVNEVEAKESSLSVTPSLPVYFSNN